MDDDSLNLDDSLDLSMQFEVSAAMFRGDGQETGDYVEFLARKLTGALPNHTKVERGGGWFSKHKPVETITVEFHDHHFVITVQKHGPVAHKAKIVRGVQLSRKELPMDQWTEELAAAVQKLANDSAVVREALKKLVDG